MDEVIKHSDGISSMFGKSALTVEKENHQRDKKKTLSTDVELGNGQRVGVNDIDDDIIESCKLSNAHDFITTFPEGYHTDVGEGSIMVSG